MTEWGVTPSRLCEGSPLSIKGVDITPSRLLLKCFSTLGGVRRGSFNLFDLTDEIPRAKALGMTTTNVIPRSASDEGSPLLMEEGYSSPSSSRN